MSLKFEQTLCACQMTAYYFCTLVCGQYQEFFKDVLSAEILLAQ